MGMSIYSYTIELEVVGVAMSSRVSDMVVGIWGQIYSRPKLRV